MNPYTDDGYKKGLLKMNGQRIARKYVERMSDKDLQGLLKATKDDPSQEAVVVAHLIQCEINKRKEKFKSNPE